MHWKLTIVALLSGLLVSPAVSQNVETLRNAASTGTIRGDAPDGLLVTAYRLRALNGFPDWEIKCNSQAAKGAFKCDNLSPGQYILASTPLDSPNSTSFFGRSDPAAAERIVVRTGEESYMRYSSSSIENGTLRVRLSSDCTSVRGARVTLARLSSTSESAQYILPLVKPSNENPCRWTFAGIASGRYAVEADWVSGDQDFHGRSIASVSPGVESLTDVLDESHAALKGAVLCSSEQSKCPKNVTLTPCFLGVDYTIPIDAGKSFKLARMRAGKYRIIVSDPEEYVESVDTNQGRHAGDLVYVHSSGDEVVVAIRSGAAVLFGKLDVPPDKKMIVVLQALDTEYSQTVVTDETKFKMAGVPPGRYRVAAWSNDVQVPYMDNNFAWLAEATWQEINVPNYVDPLTLKPSQPSALQ